MEIDVLSVFLQRKGLGPLGVNYAKVIKIWIVIWI